ncbi:FAD-dependent monooxygenase [Hoeflea poritis]|uniref:FAD-dependent monooxygenase n=1 Tax=Hoeflea poritis TaxID=2993659 RepID=A0ABT4VU16_9HYPH|nr:FAD-dependent monooxygenase [Hoeflea poritis]MDA4848200.1 FAD-dependent monooxygenase [Hoeflea poritis]
MQPRIAIVGAGIAGLCAALAFAQRGCRVDVAEFSNSLDEVGAGMQLSPNVTRLLGSLGTGRELSRVMVEPSNLSLLSGLDLRALNAIPVERIAAARWNGPYGVVHRADLQGLLADAAKMQPAIRLFLGKRITAETEDMLVDQLTELTGDPPDMVIGADGVWSTIRKFAPGASPATFSGTIAWRGLLEPDIFADIADQDNVNAFLAPHTHLVTYPLGHRGHINAVAVTPGKIKDRDWDNVGDTSVLLDHFNGWSDALRNALASTSWRYWPLFEVRHTCFVAGRRTVLIGDAAHAMTPHAAQGAAMAIEDACALAACYEAVGGNARDTISRFDALRTPRVARVRKRSDFNKFAYHAGGFVRLARNAVLAVRSGESLASDLDWLYGYDATDLSHPT